MSYTLKVLAEWQRIVAFWIHQFWCFQLLVTSIWVLPRNKHTVTFKYTYRWDVAYPKEICGFQQSCFWVPWLCIIITLPTAISREKIRCTATDHVSSFMFLLSKQCTLLRKCPFSTGVKVQYVSKEWRAPQYFTARIRIQQLQLPAQSQDGICRNSNIMIFIFQVNGICLHQKSGIQLWTEPAKPCLTQRILQKLGEGGCLVCFFLNALISLDNRENRTKQDKDKS